MHARKIGSNSAAIASAVAAGRTAGNSGLISQLWRSIGSQTRYSTATTDAVACPHLVSGSGAAEQRQQQQHQRPQESGHNNAGAMEWANAKPYDRVPGPRQIPLLGNTWR